MVELFDCHRRGLNPRTTKKKKKNLLYYKSKLKTLDLVLIRGSIAVMNTMTKKQLQEERASHVIVAYLAVRVHEVSTRVLARQELMERPWGSAAYCLVSYGLLSLISYSTIVPKMKGWHHPQGPLTSVINQENALPAYLQANLVVAFLN